MSETGNDKLESISILEGRDEMRTRFCQYPRPSHAIIHFAYEMLQIDHFVSSLAMVRDHAISKHYVS